MYLPFKLIASVAVATLWLGSSANAAPQNRNGTILHGEHIISFDGSSRPEGKSYTAFIRFDDQPAFLKCIADKKSFQYELATLTAIHGNDPSRYGLPPDTKKLFARVLGIMTQSSEQHCIVFERLEGADLFDFGGQMTDKQKDEILPDIFLQTILALRYMHHIGWVHGDIKPENIFIRRNGPNGRPRIALIDFDASQRVVNDRQEMITGTPGYFAPEDYLVEPSNQFKRESWMLGATIYTTLTDVPPYGFYFNTEKNDYEQFNPWEMHKQMVHIMDTNTHTCPPIETSHNSHLLALVGMLMKCRAEDRPLISDLDSSLLIELAAREDTHPEMAQIWERVQANTATISHP
ncbi:kinase-like domain-containing protein [Thamnocephalis sphaerospora]|uniref:Kinase-like domain-containing protein n=1 Tax=Thamnocephalis sphaerospora TaxID=78915 RepID=A0A4P9XVZ7_9FUNG|nr:kinase-like domain-containing protein [Thamnocephalis sphaerospora]|eukprot:RKP10466.1 kinase-like domain-containing protein [Thamnocephalis sphaerospora]